jgi:Ca2+/Na+ antiporter
MAASFFIQYIIMSLIMTNSASNITFSVGKFYISVIMALLMGFVEVSMFDFHMKTLHITYYLSLFIGFAIFLYLYKSQSYIDDDEYLKEMIEHHSMALLTSDEVLQKTKSERVKKLADNIVATQTAEIDYMRRLLK